MNGSTLSILRRHLIDAADAAGAAASAFTDREKERYAAEMYFALRAAAIAAGFKLSK